MLLLRPCGALPSLESHGPEQIDLCSVRRWRLSPQPRANRAWAVVAGWSRPEARRRGLVDIALCRVLSDAALVVESDRGKGGTWQGAVEQIQKLKVVPLYTRTSGPDSEGLEELRKLGAHSWPEFHSKEKLREFMQAIRERDNDAELPLFSQPDTTETDGQDEIVNETYTEVLSELSDRPDTLKVTESAAASDSYSSPQKLPDRQEISRQAQDLSWKDKLFRRVEEVILQILEEQGPLTRDDMAIRLDTAKGQTDSWLKQLEYAGKIERLPKPTRYQIRKSDQMSFPRPLDESAASPNSSVAKQ